MFIVHLAFNILSLFHSLLKQENPKSKRAGRLLDILPKRGPKAMKHFIDALMNTGHENLACMLDNDLANGAKSPSSHSNPTSNFSDIQHPSDERAAHLQRPHFEGQPIPGNLPQQPGTGLTYYYHLDFIEYHWVPQT